MLTGSEKPATSKSKPPESEARGFDDGIIRSSYAKPSPSGSVNIPEGVGATSEIAAPLRVPVMEVTSSEPPPSGVAINEPTTERSVPENEKVKLSAYAPDVQRSKTTTAESAIANLVKVLMISPLPLSPCGGVQPLVLEGSNTVAKTAHCKQRGFWRRIPLLCRSLRISVRHCRFCFPALCTLPSRNFAARQSP